MLNADLVRVVIAGAVLLTFVAVFLQEAWNIWSRREPRENEARTYVWTAISVLLGSVTAFSLGVDYPEVKILANVGGPEKWRSVYAVAYTVVGLAAVVTWFYRTQWSTVLMKNLATTFLGIAIPVVSNWLIVPK